MRNVYSNSFFNRRPLEDDLNRNTSSWKNDLISIDNIHSNVLTNLKTVMQCCLIKTFCLITLKMIDTKRDEFRSATLTVFYDLQQCQHRMEKERESFLLVIVGDVDEHFLEKLDKLEFLRWTIIHVIEDNQKKESCRNPERRISWVFDDMRAYAEIQTTVFTIQKAHFLPKIDELEEKFIRKKSKDTPNIQLWLKNKPVIQSDTNWICFASYCEKLCNCEYLITEINDFKLTYHPRDVHKWYVNESPIQKIIHYLIRCEDAGRLELIRFFIDDLSNFIHENSLKATNALVSKGKVYHSQIMTKPELDRMQNYKKGTILVCDEFLIGTSSSKIAEMTAISKIRNQDFFLQKVMFKIKWDQKCSNNTDVFVWPESPEFQQYNAIFDIGAQFQYNGFEYDDETQFCIIELELRDAIDCQRKKKDLAKTSGTFDKDGLDKQLEKLFKLFIPHFILNYKLTEKESLTLDHTEVENPEEFECQNSSHQQLNHNTKCMPVFYFKFSLSNTNELIAKFSKIFALEYRRFIKQHLTEKELQTNLEMFHSIVYVADEIPEFMKDSPRIKFYKLSFSTDEFSCIHYDSQHKIQRLISAILNDLALFYIEVSKVLPSDEKNKPIKCEFFKKISVCYRNIHEEISELDD